MYGVESGVSKHTPRRPRMWVWLKSFIMKLSAKKSLTSSSDTRSVHVSVCICCSGCGCACMFVWQPLPAAAMRGWCPKNTTLKILKWRFLRKCHSVVEKYIILLMVLIATCFLVSDSADCINVPRYTLPNAPTEEYRVQNELHTVVWVRLSTYVHAVPSNLIRLSPSIDS